jgi:hypothetical protein
MFPQFVRSVRVFGIFFAGVIGCLRVAGTRGLAVDFLHEATEVGRSAACTLTRDVAVSAAVITIAGKSFLMAYSHSIVAGGFDVTSRTTRFIPGTSFVMRVEIFSRTSYGIRDQSAVIASSLETGRNTIGWP